MPTDNSRCKFEFKKQDAWFGIYWNELHIWICIIPFFPLHILRKSVCRHCHKRIDGEYGSYGWHDKIKNQRYSNYTDELVTCWKAQQINDIADEECT